MRRPQARFIDPTVMRCNRARSTRYAVTAETFILQLLTDADGVIEVGRLTEAWRQAARGGRPFETMRHLRQMGLVVASWPRGQLSAMYKITAAGRRVLRAILAKAKPPEHSGA